MSDFVNLVLEYLKKRTTESLLGILALAILSTLLLAQAHLLKLVKNTDPSILVLIIILGFATIVVLISCLVFYYPRFKHIPSIGVHENIKNGTYFCTACLVKDKIHSPLKTETNGWRCLVTGCYRWYKNPDYIEPPPQPEQPRSIYRS